MWVQITGEPTLGSAVSSLRSHRAGAVALRALAAAMGNVTCNNTHCCHAASATCQSLFTPKEYEPEEHPGCVQEYEEPALPKTLFATSSRDRGHSFTPSTFHLEDCGTDWNSFAADVEGGVPAPGAPVEISRISRVSSKSNWSRSDVARDSYFTRELAEPVSAMLAAGYADGPRPKYFFMTGASYEGQWLGTSRSGLGLQYWPDGTRYHGEWNDSLAEGRGEFEHADGGVYVGEWKANVAHGHGFYYDSHGLTTYGGEWENDLQHGCGMEVWDGGSKYKGQFLMGNKHGHGIYNWPDGSSYCGEWRRNKIHGFGHYTGVDGREFRGAWQDSMIHGCGEYTWPDGRSFFGQYENDQKSGFGIFTWPDGRRFEGFWREGKQHGVGITYLADGEVISHGRWVHGELEADDDDPQSSAAYSSDGSRSRQ